MTVEKKSSVFKKLGITSGISLVFVFGCIVASAKWIGKTVAEPKIAAIASRVDSINHIPILKRLEAVESNQNLDDSNTTIIKMYLEVMATNDERIKVRDRLSNPTGIH